MSHYIKTNKKFFLYTLLCIFISLFLSYAARNIDGFAQWYAEHIFPVFPNTIGRLFSLFPFSVFEMGIYIIIILIFFVPIYGIWLFLYRRSKLNPFLMKVFRNGICLLSSFLLIFNLSGGINYSRDTFSQNYGMRVQDSSREDLIKLSVLLISDLEELASEVQTDKNGLLTFDEAEVREAAVSAMHDLGDKYYSLSGYNPEPKPVLFSEAMSYLGITGIYSPFTLEANYNRDVPSYVIPYTICHELAHLKGYMREEEAGFIAYKACRDSSSETLKYSGTVNALSYTLNALYKYANPEEYSAVYNMIPEKVKYELSNNKQYWQRHTAEITDIAESANEKYLVANAQAEGTNSYGIMVDLLLSEYADLISEDSVL